MCPRSFFDDMTVKYVMEDNRKSAKRTNNVQESFSTIFS